MHLDSTRTAPGEDEGSGAIAKINQDCGCVCYPFAEDDELALLLVMDGHGPEGEKARRRPPMHPMMHAMMMMMMMHLSPSIAPDDDDDDDDDDEREPWL